MTALRKPVMSRDDFFVWAEAQNGRYEFDGFEPVAMTGGTNNHSRICHNLWFALRSRLRGSGCDSLGPDAGLATIGNVVRYPDALVTCAEVDGEARLVAGVVVVFEVLSPTSIRTDRVIKVAEYRAVESLRRYVILDYAAAHATVLTRDASGDDWTSSTLGVLDTIEMPEIGISVPVAELYDRIEF